jgi:polyhydroxyalkanoate synthesis repressor PhaR
VEGWEEGESVATTPIVIKRYENRKLYDTSRSVYVTLEDVATLIRDGKDIRVVDAKTNEDLTKSTLAQIVLEQERDKKNLLPLSFMMQLIKYGEAIQGTFQEYLSSGFETFVTSQLEVQKRMREWAETASQKKARPEPEAAAATRPERKPDDAIRAELEELKRKVAELESQRKRRKK